MKPKLKRCPFCNGDAYHETYPMVPWEKMVIPDNDGNWYLIVCDECGAQSDVFATLEEAVVAWNRRLDDEKEKEN